MLLNSCKIVLNIILNTIGPSSNSKAEVFVKFYLEGFKPFSLLIPGLVGLSELNLEVLELLDGVGELDVPVVCFNSQDCSEEQKTLRES